ncbi:Lin1244/Lin1753 domain-containing protein [Megasphaera sueciensis]|uniref:Lin1244/Lin1753 domain-containing protein n=1 Tax=Megasphaera sueciensis TaxID=349094 RepID=UPI003D03C487
MKKGIDYFPLDVDFFEDEKIQLVSARFGVKGEILTIRLLTRIYHNGYFIKWDEDAAFLFSKSAGQEITPSLANSIVYDLVKRGFFDESLFNSLRILTSRGIQERFLKACERRKFVEIDQCMLLVDPTDFKNLKVSMSSLSMHLKGKCKHDDNILDKNVDIFQKNVDISKQSKVEESKVEESKVEGEEDTLSDFQKLVKIYQNNIHPISSPIERDKLSSLLDDFGLEIITKAIERSVSRGKRNIGYVTAILNNWQQNGYDEENKTDKKQTAADRRKADRERRRARAMEIDSHGSGECNRMDPKRIPE